MNKTFSWNRDILEKQSLHPLISSTQILPFSLFSFHEFSLLLQRLLHHMYMYSASHTTAYRIQSWLVTLTLASPAIAAHKDYCTDT